MNKHIFIFMPTLKVGGAERMVQKIATGLAFKNRVTLAFISHNEKGALLDFPESIALVPLSSKSTRKAFFELFHLIKALKPDIVFSSWSRSNVLLLALKIFFSNIKVVIREPNLPSFSLPRLKFGHLYKYLYRVFYPNADLIICQSQQMKTELADFFLIPHHKLIVIHNFLETQNIKVKVQTTDSLFSIKPDDFISCGRLEYQKGYDLLIPAFANVVKQYSNARLIIFGEGSMRKVLQEMIDGANLANNIFLPGEVANPFFYMNACFTYISSSRWEGLPNTVLEAMACGANILATDCPGATSEIIEHGVNGWLVPANSSEELSKGIINCVTGKWRLQNENIISQATKFDIGNLFLSYEDAFMHISRT